MKQIKVIKVTTGVFWVSIEAADVYMLCGCPADAVKHLKKRGLIEEVSENGQQFESGPNAILLSDLLMQNGNFSNLTEFPVLQMLYLQGMIIPNHPNNKGTRPILIGSKEQLEAQMEYIFRGNYGLISKEEIMETGIAEQEAEEMMRIKRYFAFNKIRSTEELLDKRIIEDAAVEIRNGVYVKRKNLNIYEISYQDETITIDLNLKLSEKYEAPFQLGYHFIHRDYFSVVHSGEGDGWDINRPCMASILIFQGKVYLIDAGPNILVTLNYLGISVNEIEGIFHTHAHDDHFAGLTTLIRTDRRFKYYATPLVRKAVTKKLSALMSFKEAYFEDLFDVQDLDFDTWNNINGLEVRPVYSPHPVETNIFFFRTKWGERYIEYAHLADVVSVHVFRDMITDDPMKPGVGLERFRRVISDYTRPAHLKKIDVGGGMIHGEAEDYRGDSSAKIVLAHTHKALTMKQREIGTEAAFGTTDVLIPANHNYLIDAAYKYLRFYFPNAPEHELQYLLNHPLEQITAGSMLFKKGQATDNVYLLLTGSVQFADSKTGILHVFSAGSLIGFYSGYLGLNALETYWASSNISVLTLPSSSYHDFVARNNLYLELRRMEEHIVFLGNTSLFGEIVSFPILTKIAQVMQRISFENNELMDSSLKDLYLVLEGKVDIFQDNELIKTLQKGDFFGGEERFSAQTANLRLQFSEGHACYKVPINMACQIPIVYWKLLESYERRLRKA
ncbi:MAG: cyclic nucleotide-binding domain-containing protein [Bernardetiaceae bacterium]|nr:cyclic nucleotide-binding domain-containing protein [Bernardetiaceae bacterium]